MLQQFVTHGTLEARGMVALAHGAHDASNDCPAAAAADEPSSARLIKLTLRLRSVRLLRPSVSMSVVMAVMWTGM